MATGRCQLAETPAHVRNDIVRSRAKHNARAGISTVVLPGGREVPRDVLFVAAPPAPRDAAIAHLSLERTGPDLLAGRHVRPHLRRRRVRRRDLVTVAPAVAQPLATGQRAAVGVTRDLAAAHVAAG